MKKATHKTTVKILHRWIGLFLAVFILLFCISGVILNHRGLFSLYSISRNLLPSEYSFKNFNNGIIKGTVELHNGKILAYGNSGIWLTNKDFNDFEDFNNGLPEGIDHRNIRNTVQTKDGSLICAANFSPYRYDRGQWVEINLPGNTDRIADVTLDKDSLSVVILTRSAIYRQNPNGFERVELKSAENHPVKFTLFKALWMLHSGEIFGIIGKIIVDCIAIILIFLSITGIILFILPYSIRRAAISYRLTMANLFKWNFKWHDKIGYLTAILTGIIAFTGMCLRPPLMVPAVLIKTSPIPGTKLDSDNPWQDRLRAIRWNSSSGNWLISTSEGFLKIEETMTETPHLLDPKTSPPVSPMGVNVLEPTDDGKWLVGSFSGMYVWNPSNGYIEEYFSRSPYITAKTGRPLSDNLISGYSDDFHYGPKTFDYSTGMDGAPEMPETLLKQPMSLWNFALELHVGRCYSPLIGPFSSLFIFLSGGLLLTVIITGLLLHNRTTKRKNNINSTTK